ncbi:MAG: PDGLE domain-containing protein [Methanosarcinaceae archaeon]|nr:PDGLE domain-containing protein [Methanosarcinaceae archaeon]MDF1534619.1 PDGLE domain-containing protein [Methanosarcinaceae archaeon]
MTENKSNDLKTILLAGLAVAILLSVLAPFLASSNPDGLESAAEDVIDEHTFAEMEENEPIIGALMPDYAIAGFGKAGEVGAIFIGSIFMLGLGLGVGKLFEKKI